MTVLRIAERSYFTEDRILWINLFLYAKAFEPLLHIKYHIIIGRKGKAVDLTISFEAVEFHHLIGLHKLRDNRLARGNREKIFYDILAGRVTLSDIEKSIYFPTIQNRFEPFCQLETLFDQNNLVFRYNPKLQSLSLIEAEYLLSTPHENTDIYIFLDKKETAGEFFCRSFFPKENTDYTKGQAIYTLLKKEKINTLTGDLQVQYDRLAREDYLGQKKGPKIL